MSSKVPRLLLFDIDATLIRSVYSKTNPLQSYICLALQQEFGREVKRNDIVFSGGTDGSIAADLLGQYGINEESCPDYEDKIQNSFLLMPQLMRDGISQGSYNWEILENVNKLLEALSKRTDVKIGLLTGNHRVTAQIKLENAGVDVNYFRWGAHDGDKNALFGSFGGSDHHVRNKLVDIARDRYAEYLGVTDIAASDMVVIGDSPKDIECAHVNGVACVGVDTGIFTADQLQAADVVLPGGFADISAAVNAIVNVKRMDGQGASASAGEGLKV